MKGSPQCLPAHVADDPSKSEPRTHLDNKEVSGPSLYSSSFKDRWQIMKGPKGPKKERKTRDRTEFRYIKEAHRAARLSMGPGTCHIPGGTSPVLRKWCWVLPKTFLRLWSRQRRMVSPMPGFIKTNTSYYSIARDGPIPAHPSGYPDSNLTGICKDVDVIHLASSEKNKALHRYGTRRLMKRQVVASKPRH